MCGIAGIVWTDAQRHVSPDLLEAMTGRLAHRGPDGQGTWYGQGVGLGHRRLSIVDIAGGAQPMGNEDGRVQVTYNGEIYNWPALHDDLVKSGHTFQSRCDTEALVHLWEEHGEAMVAMLRGMFAFGLWDARSRTLLLARDRLGKKPLVYRLDQEGLRFASELKALTIEPGFPRDIDHAALDEYLAYQYVPAPRTIYSAVKKLPPGHYAIYQDGKLRIERYWEPDYTREESLSEADWQQQLRATLTEAVRMRLMSDVPLGAFLSGGIDSTIIVGLMQEVAREPVRTFSIGFPIAAYDETAYAREAANFLGTKHEEQIVQPDAVSIVDRLAWYYDEPFGDSSAVPTYYLSEMTRKHVTVALAGDAGDELFCGYHRYRAAELGQWYDRLPGPVRRLAGAQFWQRIPVPGRQRSLRRRLQRLLLFIGQSPTKRYRNWVGIFDDQLRSDLYTAEFAESLHGHHAGEFLEACYRRAPDRDFLTRTMFVDLCSYLPFDLMTKVDIASMANSLEVRAPFMDQEVVALSGRMPLSMKLRGTTAKYILKKTFADLLPPSIQRRGKMGFGVPLDHWFRDELSGLVNDVLLGDQLAARGWFRPEKIKQLVDLHLTGRRDHAPRLWSLLMLEMWARNYLDAGSSSPLPLAAASV